MEIAGLGAKAVEANVFCHACQRDTNHNLQYARTYAEYENLLDSGERHRYGDWWLMWKCNGCNNLTLQDATADLDLFHEDQFALERLHLWTVFPKQAIKPKRFMQIPNKIDGVYTETVSAFNNELWVLCAIGLRSIIEGLCDDKEISGKRDSLEKKIRSLTKLGIPANIAENLHGFRFMGNTAVHELVAPEREDLRLAIEIVEDLLNFVYELNYLKFRLFS